MPIFLHGLTIQNFRGIGADAQKLFPFRDFNFFIGANNSGKSTILDFLNKFLAKDEKGRHAKPSGLDLHTGGQGGAPFSAIGIPLETFLTAARVSTGGNDRIVEAITDIFADNGAIWIKIAFERGNETYVKSPSHEEIITLRGLADPIRHLWNHVFNATGGDLVGHWIPQLANRFLEAQNLNFPKVQLIPAIRQIGPKAETFSDFSGRGLIDKIAEIQSPDHDRRKDKDIFDSINGFLQTVTSRLDA